MSPVNHAPLIDPFLGAISIEQDLNAQIGCCLCLKAAIDAGALDERDEEDLRKRVLPKVMKLLKGDGFKAKGALLGVMESVVGVNDGVVINGGRSGANLVGNVVGVAVEMLSSEDWMARKSAAEALLKMAVVVDVDSAAEVKRFVVNSLDSRRFDKVKVTREIMNRALEAWKEVPGGPEEEIALSRSNSSISKDSGTTGGASPPPNPRRFSYAGTETPKAKKAMAKCRSSLSDCPVATISPSMSPSTQDSIGFDTPQRRKTLTKSRSSLSDDSTITDISLVSKSCHDVAFEAAQSKRSMPKGRSSLPLKAYDKKLSVYQNAEPKKSSDWRVEIAVSPAPSEKVLSEMSSNFVKKASEERVPKISASKSGSRVVPLVEEDERPELDFQGGRNEQVGEKNAESEDLSLIRKQLRQIERQQSDLLVLIQRFMGNSQSGIDSLETRVSGLEKALDEISRDLAVQSGRITNNDSAGSTCCPSTEFLSPKFWRRTEIRSSSISKSLTGSMPNKDASVEAPQIDSYKHHEQNEGISRETWGSVKGISQTAQRGRNCSPRSFDSASTAACFTSVVRGA